MQILSFRVSGGSHIFDQTFSKKEETMKTIWSFKPRTAAAGQKY